MKGKGSNLSQMINDLFLGVLSTTFSLEIMKNYLRDQISSLTRGWHVLRGGEFEISAPEDLEMLTTLLFQKVQYRLRAGDCPIVSNLRHGIRQKLELAVQPLNETPNVICNFKLLGFGTKVLEDATVGHGQMCPPLMAIGLIFL
jgi:hypothetical protein